MSRGVALSTVWPPLRGALRRVAVREMCMDSAAVQSGSLFLAVPGAADDGRRHIAEALGRGAAAVFAERHGMAPAGWPDASAPVVAVPGLRPRISAMAARFFGDPSASLWTLGVTGTKGKTSCAWLVAEALRTLGSRCGMMGTLGFRLADGPLRALARTTPDPVSAQRLLAELRRRGAEAAVIEVSSHALVQSRVAAVRFDAAVFTNLHAEHLDYHPSEAAYLRAKRQLFRSRQLRCAIFNADDPHAAAAAAEAGSAERVGVGLRAADADCRAREIDHGRWGISALVDSPWGRGRLSLPLPGEFNLRNALCALCALCAGGWPLDMALSALARARPPPGRMQAVHESGDDIAVVVDYAHTAESLRAALTALRAARSAGRLWCVFGAGGDRYADKRPEMGRSAAQCADVLVLSSDNPRTELPERIIDDIMAGIDGADAEVRVETDRAAAIETAVSEARAGDAVLIAGKGHETHQHIGGARVPFSDARAAAAALRRRRAGAPEVAR